MTLPKAVTSPVAAYNTAAAANPILVPAWALSIALLIGPAVVAWLLGGEWKVALATAITAVIGQLAVASKAAGNVTPVTTAQANVEFATAAAYAQGVVDTTPVVPPVPPAAAPKRAKPVR